MKEFYYRKIKKFIKEEALAKESGDKSLELISEAHIKNYKELLSQLK